MRINHNIASLNTYRQLSMNTVNGSKSLEKLSSGLRINRAGDDAAGLAISEKMRGQIRGLDQAARNAQDGISLIQTAEGALNETHSILQRMRELAVQSANDTNTANDRAEIQKEIDQLAIEITRIANNTEFNTQKLLNGGITDSGLGVNSFHIGANAGQSLTISIGAMDAKTLGVSRDIVAAELAEGAVDVTEATVSGTPGSAVVEGAQISVSAAKVDAKEASITGENAHGVDGTNTLEGITGASLSITIGNTTFTADNNEIEAWGALANATALINAVGAIEDGSGKTLSEVADISVDGSNKLVITSKTAGLDDTISIDVTAGTESGTNGVNLETMLGIGTAVIDKGSDASYTVTLSDGGTNSVDIQELTGSETSIAGTDAFAGLVLTTDGDFNESLNAEITVSLKVATAASFDGGVTTDAVTEAGIDVSSQVAANIAITTIEEAITKVSAERSKLGAYQNRLEHTINNLQASAENLTASESRIRDVDMAKEMMEFTKNNILTQAAQAMLAQANMQPQGVLQLLR